MIDVLRDVEMHVESGETVMIAGIDRLERLKGLPLKLLAFEQFLGEHPAWVGRVVLAQLGLQAPERGGDYKATRAEVNKLVKRINARFGGAYAAPAEPKPGWVYGAVVYRECKEADAKLRDRLALLAGADVLWVSDVRSGLNRLPLEYVVAQHFMWQKEQARASASGAAAPAAVKLPGFLLMSEFASATRVLQGAFHVNPWRISDVVATLASALAMGPEMRARRHAKDAEYVLSNTTATWAGRLLDDLKSIDKDSNYFHAVGLGLGLGFHIIAMDSGFDALDTNSVASAYRKAASRAIFLDYGGTTYSEDDKIDHIKHFNVATGLMERPPPSRALLTTLANLASDKKNTVFIVSGKERKDLARALGATAKLGLAAEHGLFFRWPQHAGGDDRGAHAGGEDTSHASAIQGWETLVPMGTAQTWKVIARSIMELYAQRTQGTYIEENESAVVWQCVIRTARARSLPRLRFPVSLERRSG